MAKLDDNSTARGAATLAGRIQTYWHRRGFRGALVERYEVDSDSGIYGVRSNLVNGKPPGAPDLVGMDFGA